MHALSNFNHSFLAVKANLSATVRTQRFPGAFPIVSVYARALFEVSFCTVEMTETVQAFVLGFACRQQATMLIEPSVFVLVNVAKNRVLAPGAMPRLNGNA